MKRVVIVAAKRTPFGKFLGSLAELSPVELAVIAGESALNEMDRAQISQLLLGNILGAGHGMNIARQVALRLQLPVDSAATTVNMMCGSGMQSVLLAVNAIRAGEANAVLAGGVESMSQSMLGVRRPGKKQQPDFANVTDTMLSDGLYDPDSQSHMGLQAEQLASDYDISREQQDCFALRSQRLYSQALESGSFHEELTTAGELTMDEHPRPRVTVDELSQLKPVFRDGGSVTAGNASGINDGAAMLLLAELEFARSQRWPVLAEWVEGVAVGCDPDRMGLGPVHAIRKLFSRTGKQWADVDALEINEAFAVQTLACLRELGLDIDLSVPNELVTASDGHKIRLNAEGGAIAVGHPLGASGARLLTHMAWQVSRGKSRNVIGSLCIGGGQGIAAMLKQPTENE